MIGVVNLKGGCGKSNIAVNLACEIASKGHAVTLIDADAQGTAHHWASAGHLPVRVEAMPLGTRSAAQWVSRVLSMTVDFIVLDAPPQIGATTQAIVGISDLVLIPITPSYADLTATASALDLVQQARRERKDGGPRCLLIPSKVDRRTASGREIEGALKQFGEPVGPAVHQRAAFIDSLSAGEWIGSYAPNSAAHSDITTLFTAIKRSFK